MPLGSFESSDVYPHQPPLFSGGGEVAELIHHYDWSHHPLGDPQQWSSCLVSSLRLMLHAHSPMFIWWSKGLYMFYNDAYLPALGQNHPQALGRPAAKVWESVWESYEKLAEGVMQGQGTHSFDEQLVPLDRKGFWEETYWNFSYNPMLDEAGQVRGIFGISQEVTRRVISERRLKTLKALTNQTLMSTVVSQVGERACRALAQHPEDAPFALVYLLEADGRSARRVGHTPTAPADRVPEIMHLRRADAEWPFAQVHRTLKLVLVDSPHAASESTQSPWAVVVPIYQPDQQRLRGFFVAGISTQLEYTPEYADFFQLLAGQIATAMAQVEAREAADRQQKRLINIFEQAPVGIFTFRGPDQVIELANPTALAILGRTTEEILNKPLLEAVPEVDEQRIKELLDGVFYSGESFVGNEIPATFLREGQPVKKYFDFVYHPWRNEREQIVGVIAVGIDVSERISARREVEAKNNELTLINDHLDQALQQAYQLTALLDNSPDFIGLANPAGKGVYVNPAGLKMVGLDPSFPVSDLSVDTLFFPEDVPHIQNTILSQALNDGIWVGEYQFRHLQTGEPVPVLYSSFAVKDPRTDELLGLATIAIDITDRKQKEAQLQQFQEQLAVANEELAAANEELIASNQELIETNLLLTHVNADLDNFVYAASHDLKAPISNIQGLLQLLERNLPSDDLAAPNTKKVLRMMNNSVARFMKTIVNLSEITKLQKEANQPAESVNLAEVVRDVQMDIAQDIEKSGAQINVSIYACGPIHFAPKNLRSVVYNLLSNAIKYRSPHRKPVIDIRCEETPEYQVLTVSDNGLGMNLTAESKLFTMFRRLHDHVEGTGVGLYIVKKIVENAGGKIIVKSQLDQGSTFTVYFKR